MAVTKKLRGDAPDGFHRAEFNLKDSKDADFIMRGYVLGNYAIHAKRVTLASTGRSYWRWLHEIPVSVSHLPSGGSIGSDQSMDRCLMLVRMLHEGAPDAQADEAGMAQMGKIVHAFRRELLRLDEEERANQRRIADEARISSEGYERVGEINARARDLVQTRGYAPVRLYMTLSGHQSCGNGQPPSHTKYVVADWRTGINPSTGEPGGGIGAETESFTRYIDAEARAIAIIEEFIRS